MLKQMLMLNDLEKKKCIPTARYTKIICYAYDDSTFMLQLLVSFILRIEESVGRKKTQNLQSIFAR